MLRFFIIFALKLVLGNSTDVETPSVTISAWQFCEGCKITVDAYAQLAARELRYFDTLPKTEKRTLDAMKITDRMCDDSFFYDFKDFAKFSCIKVLDDTRQKFLEEFTGSTTVAALSSKERVFSRKKKICVDHTQACKASAFDDVPLIGTKRNNCAACTLIANDIDTIKRSKNTTTSLRSILDSDEKSFCDTLGYNHSPYGWLEDLCEEMLEERLESILEVVEFHDKLANSGFNPDQTMAQMMCEEFYGCDKDLKQTKKPKPKAKAKAKAKGKPKTKAQSGKPAKLSSEL